jgi:lauroyl/myristoyl acyltransferase
MQDQGVRILFITHHAGGIEYPAAYLSYKHLLRHLGARDENELRDLGIQAERESPIETFMRRRDEALRRARSQRR